MLDRLPPELLLDIIRRLGARRQDLKALCRVSKQIHARVVPVLYHPVTLFTRDEGRLEALNDPTSLVLARFKGYFRHTRDIRVIAPFHSKTSTCDNRCFHNYKWTAERDEMTIARSVRTVLEGCQEGNLRCFRWELGSCIPELVLRCLATKQRNLESLHFITDGSCRRSQWEWSDDCTWLTNLKRFSWAGLWGLDSENTEFKTLVSILNGVSHQLEDLSINFEYYVENWGYYGVQLSELLLVLPAKYKLRPSTLWGMFPVLRSLTLSRVSFGRTEAFGDETPGILHAFDFSTIESLKLRSCYGWERVLGHLTTMLETKSDSRRFAMRCLEVTDYDDTNDYMYLYSRPGQAEDRPAVIISFLESFEGLQSIFIGLGTGPPELNVWRAASHHRQTLRQFVYHQQKNTLDWDKGPVDEDEEADEESEPLLSSDSEASGLIGDDSPRHPLQGLANVRSIGLGFQLRWMKHILCPFKQKNSELRLLHIRRSGREMDGRVFPFSHLYNQKWIGEMWSFLKWIFGPTGIPTLRMVVYGDWSCDGRFGKFNWLAVRSENKTNRIRRDSRYECARKHCGIKTYDIYDGLSNPSNHPDLGQDFRDLFREHENLVTSCARSYLLS